MLMFNILGHTSLHSVQYIICALGEQRPQERKDERLPVVMD